MSQPFAKVPAAAKFQPTPYTINVPDERVSKLKQLVELSDLGPLTFESSHDDFEYGLPYAWLEKAKKEWETTFDW